MKLHEAMEKVLLEDFDGSAKAADIAGKINEKQLYRRKDGKPLPSSQIGARAKNYNHLFEKKNGLIELIDYKKKNNAKDNHIALEEMYYFFKNSIEELGIGEVDQFSEDLNTNASDEIEALFIMLMLVQYVKQKKVGNLGYSVNEINKRRLDGDFHSILVNDIQNVLIKDYHNESILEYSSSPVLAEVIEKYFKLLEKIHWKKLIKIIDELNIFYDTNPDNPILGYGFLFRLIESHLQVASQKIGFLDWEIPDTIIEWIRSFFDFEHFIYLFGNSGTGVFNKLILPKFQHKAVECQHHSDIFSSDPNSIFYTFMVGLDLVKRGWVTFDYSYKKELCSLSLYLPNFGQKKSVLDKTQFPFASPFESTKDAIENASTNGVSMIFVNNGFLVDSHEKHKNLRSTLISEDLLHAVISFNFPLIKNANVNISLLILDNSKPVGHKGKVNFIRVEEPKIKDFSIKLNNILYDKVKEESEHGYFFAEEELNFDKKEASFRKVEAEEISEFKFFLDPIFYLNNSDNDFFTHIGANQQLTQLDRIVTINEVPSVNHNEAIGQPFVETKDLSSNPDILKLNLNQLGVVPEISKKGKKLLKVEKDVILVNRIGNRIKSKFHKGKVNESLFLHENVYALQINEGCVNKVLPEFLVKVLKGIAVTTQIRNAQERSTIPSITIANLKQLLVQLPPIEEQNEIIRNYTNDIIERKRKEIEDIQEFSKANEYDLISAIKHEMDNIPLNSEIKRLLKYIKSKIDSKEVLSWSDNVSKAINGSTLKELTESLSHNSESIYQTFDTVRDFLDYEHKKQHFEIADFKEVIKDIFERCSESLEEFTVHPCVMPSGDIVKSELNNDFIIHGGNAIGMVDREQIAILIRNFIGNTVKHGYPENYKGKKMIFWDVIPKFDNSEVLIYLANNGIPLPENFTKKSFTKFGVKSSKSKGSGMGGYFMNRIIENHGGKFNIYSDIETSVYEVEFYTIYEDGPLKGERNEAFSQSEINLGVLFEIILPLTS
ncbi:MAG: N-6 DNA methylase [Bacteroidetes bacterium]|nr:N-6 DNA methylase [Bacteroidota bacterium]